AGGAGGRRAGGGPVGGRAGRSLAPSGGAPPSPSPPPPPLPDVGCVHQVAFSPDGKLLAAACQDKTVRVFEPHPGPPKRVLKQVAIAQEHTDFVYSVQFSPDGKSLLTIGRDSVKVWSMAALMKRKK